MECWISRAPDAVVVGGLDHIATASPSHGSDLQYCCQDGHTGWNNSSLLKREKCLCDHNSHVPLARELSKRLRREASVDVVLLRETSVAPLHALFAALPRV